MRLPRKPDRTAHGLIRLATWLTIESGHAACEEKHHQPGHSLAARRELGRPSSERKRWRGSTQELQTDAPGGKVAGSPDMRRQTGGNDSVILPKPEFFSRLLNEAETHFRDRFATRKVEREINIGPAVRAAVMVAH
jgi:hypothetical protein